MFAGFARYPDGNTETLASLEGVAPLVCRDDVGLWIDLQEPSEADLRSVGETLKLDQEALEDCLHGEQRARIDEYDDHIFLVVYGVPGVEDAAEFSPRKLAVFFGKRFLVTVHRQPMPTVGRIRERCERNATHVLARGIDFLLYQIIDGMVDRYVLLAEAYETQLDELEDKSIRSDVDESLLADVSEMRRRLIELRQMAASQRDLLLPIAEGEYAFVSESLEQRFSHVRDHLTKVVELVDGLRELLAGIRDNYHTALANRTNAVMKTLTVFAAVLLPLSLVAGIYGMNVPLWPRPDHPLSFWAIVGVMLGMAALLLYYFKRKRWL